VDAGAATASLAGCLALSPIHERGTTEQRARYMSLCAPASPGEDRKPWRGAFCLTEPLPYAGVDTGMLGGKVTIAEWRKARSRCCRWRSEGASSPTWASPTSVTAAVDTADPRITGSCMVILEEGDPGVFDRGSITRKLVHQLSSTSDPIFSLRVPASRIVGGYTVKEGRIVPNFNHSEIIEAVFARTRCDGGSDDLGQAAERGRAGGSLPANRFRGAQQIKAGSLRYEQGLQQREDALHRVVDLWAMGEARRGAGLRSCSRIRRARSAGKGKKTS